MNSVLLDTSFLISLSDPARAHHGVAQQFYKECIARRVPMFLSTVVISKYQVKQAINDLPLRNFIVLPFNVDHAMPWHAACWFVRARGMLATIGCG